MSEKVFLESRLRYGVYGQRQSGVQMQRIKIPLGILSTEQMIRLADLSEEYADGVSHITTRQDVQFHFINLEDTPDHYCPAICRIESTDSSQRVGQIGRGVPGAPVKWGLSRRA